jgi:uncharacterized protein YfdQ (DUF2303 family)
VTMALVEASARPSSEAQAIINVVAELGGFEVVNVEDPSNDGQKCPVAVLPSGKHLESLRPYLEEYVMAAPRRREGTAVLEDPQAFVDLVNRHKDPDSVLFACARLSDPSVTAVLDYHKKDHTPRFGEHRAHYAFPHSDEWKAWFGRNKREMNQKQFAEFIEDRLMDLAEPQRAGERTREYVQALEATLSPRGKVAEVSRQLEINIEQEFVSAQKLHNGEGQLIFKERHTDVQGNPVQVPSAFLIEISVFTRGALIVIPVRLRYRATKEAITFFFELAMLDELFRLAIDDQIEAIRQAVDLPCYIGSPEK